MTGIFFRIERAGRWESIELDDMTADEIRSVMVNFGRGQLIDVICQMVEAMQEAKDA